MTDYKLAGDGFEYEIIFGRSPKMSNNNNSNNSTEQKNYHVYMTMAARHWRLHCKTAHESGLLYYGIHTADGQSDGLTYEWVEPGSCPVTLEQALAYAGDRKRLSRKGGGVRPSPEEMAGRYPNRVAFYGIC